MFKYIGCFLTMPFCVAAQSVTVNTQDTFQVIDGFGAYQEADFANQPWWSPLFYDDLRASILRVDLTPRFISPYSNLNYYSPWFMGSSVVSVFNLEDPANPNGPEGNRVRTYTSPLDYSNTFGGLQPPIAVMGPDIDANVNLFTYSDHDGITQGLAQQAQLGEFKLIGSIWSPAPWLKVSSGNVWTENWWPGPVAGTPWPFIWGGNFAGGRLDVSGVPLSVFDDGAGPTSALTQFARSTAAYIRGYQQHHGAQFYAISIQNELNFEQFYNSCTYPLSSQYIAALKAVRAEFDQHPDLQNIRLMGPEDLLGGDSYGLWEYGGGAGVIHKNLQYLANIAADSAAAAAVDFFCIHGYDANGVSAAGAPNTSWQRWANGWDASPAPGIPDSVAGFNAYHKKSWMTETSGEDTAWLYPSGAFPGQGAFGLAMGLHYALTVGNESAFVYWTFAGPGNPSSYTLTSGSSGANSPKYNAAKHFYRHIRPGSVRVGTTASGNVFASAYKNETSGNITVVLINPSDTAKTVNVEVPGFSNASLDVFTSSNESYWQQSQVPLANSEASVSIPAYGVVTIHGEIFSQLPESLSSPPSLRLSPNPTRGAVSVSFRVSHATRTRVAIVDVTGREVQVVYDGLSPSGNHSVMEKLSLTGGFYLCTLTTPSGAVSAPLIVTP